jgi:transcriptional regulator with XRE-family HTH domain
MSIDYRTSIREIAMKPASKTLKPRNLRQRLGLNQQEFWSAVGVTQSGGSRYESGRNMPKPVRELVRLVHIEGINLARARREDFEVAQHLRTKNVALYRRLLEESRKNAAR